MLQGDTWTIQGLLIALFFCEILSFGNVSAQNKTSCAEEIDNCPLGNPILTVDSICSSQRALRTCLKNLEEKCEDTETLSAVYETVRFFEYRCSSAGMQDYDQLLNCSKYVNISQCEESGALGSNSNFRLALRVYQECMNRTCGPQAARFGCHFRRYAYLLLFGETPGSGGVRNETWGVCPLTSVAGFPARIRGSVWTKGNVVGLTLLLLVVFFKDYL